MFTLLNLVIVTAAHKNLVKKICEVQSEGNLTLLRLLAKSFRILAVAIDTRSWSSI